MYKFMRKYNRKILAYLAVFLMIVFILPTTFKGNSGRASRGDVVQGRIHAFDADLTSGDVQMAREDLEALRNLTTPGPRGMPGLPLIFLLASPREQQQA